jgi:beta-lactam-binding protein with PASTA domain
VSTRRRHRPWHEVLYTAFVAVAAFVVGILVFNNVLMPQLIHREAEVRVPDLLQLTEGEAQKALEPAGLQLSRSGERFDPGVMRGRIVQQDPPAGTPVRGRRRVSVVVSLGEEFSSVPVVFGETRRGAELLLQQAGLRVGGIARSPRDAVSVLPRGTPVALLLSTGVDDEVVVMPDLIGSELGRVRRQLEAQGLQVLSPPAGPSSGPIVAQDPPPGTRLTRDMSITLQAGRRIVR